ncbi:hypothetical protein [Flexibacterium corallicola]|uniref:hypothetical protein n=1 Tax=Flexibacterium corallicola TaxID=3037259 RepID=UPI00286FAD9B|nr:hypothetical protein [Pseudovibrio sp. M1P-2-3]
MKYKSEYAFTGLVEGQIQLLNLGKPLEAFDRYFDVSGVMFANGELFADGAAMAREKQEPYIAAATSIRGQIIDLKMNSELQICVFRNRTSFTIADGTVHQIDGLCWQQWREGKIVEERYFDGTKMQSQIDAGILDKPEILVDTKL